MKVPFLPLNQINKPHYYNFLTNLHTVLEQGDYTNGKFVKQFEYDFEKTFGLNNAIGVGSGLDGLVLGLRSVIKPSYTKAKIIIPAMSFFATLEAVELAKFTPIFVDVDDSGLIDLNQVESLLKKDTFGGIKGVMPVHLFGQAVKASDLQVLKNKYPKIAIIEDACQAHGAAGVGSVGDAVAFSFYPGKNLGALGDAGLVAFKSESDRKTAAALAQHGQFEKGIHEDIGYTSRLDTIQAAFLIEKMKSLNSDNFKRIKAARKYGTLLNNVPTVPQSLTYFYDTPLDAFTENNYKEKLNNPKVNGHVFHLYVTLFDSERDRQTVEREFTANGIGFGRHYPVALPDQPYCKREYTSFNSGYDKARKYANRSLSLPIWPGIEDKEIEYVVKIMKDALVR